MERFSKKLQYPDIREVSIKNGFWPEIIKKTTRITLQDVWTKYEKDNSKQNFLNVINRTSFDHFNGNPWQDGMIYEIICGASDLFTSFKDRILETKIDEFIEIIKKAQDTVGDGYINTFTQSRMPDKRFGQNGGFIIIQHDLYNAGCLFEAGVHHYLATGKKTLLSVAVKMANYICSEIGYPPKKNIVSGHPMIEQATVQLYRLFKDNPSLAQELNAKTDEYLELARFWIDYRGVHDGRASFPHNLREYCQDHRPLREQKEAVGHAVRAALLYYGLAKVANETDDDELFSASEELWKNVIETKMHVNGGIGAVEYEEQFSYQYDLRPNAYLETCAGVALAFWAAEMHRAYGNSSFFDIFERVLSNNVLASVSEDGKKYTYVNPLISDGNSGRWDWHPCPCCPPMFLKMIGSLKTYIYSCSDNDLYVNLYISSSLSNDKYCVDFENRKMHIKKVPDCRHTIYFRIPDYADDFFVYVNGDQVDYTVKKGYAAPCMAIAENDIVEIKFNENILIEEAHPYARENIYGFQPISGVSIRKGPFVYCAEGIDNGNNLNFIIAKESELTIDSDNTITGNTVDGKTFKLIPYFKWNNRGNSPMKVWLEYEGKTVSKDLEGWEGLLYRTWKKTKCVK